MYSYGNGGGSFNGGTSQVLCAFHLRLLKTTLCVALSCRLPFALCVLGQLGVFQCWKRLCGHQFSGYRNNQIQNCLIVCVLCFAIFLVCFYRWLISQSLSGSVLFGRNDIQENVFKSKSRYFNVYVTNLISIDQTKY